MEFDSVPLNKNWDLLTWVLPTLSVCPTSILSLIKSGQNLELASGNCESRDNEKSWSLRADARRRITLFSGLDPVPLSKIGSRFLASMGTKGKNRNSLVCLRNASSYSVESYCTVLRPSGATFIFIPGGKHSWVTSPQPQTRPHLRSSQPQTRPHLRSSFQT